MNKVIPILPCQDIKKQVTFYQQLGFEILGLYTSPNPYAAIQLGTIELHFYGSRKIIPSENPSMCFISVEDVDAVYDDFASRIKSHTGKVPRSGIPRISKVRDLKNDRRFTLTDTGGNTLFIGTPVKENTSNFFRTLEHEDYTKKFAALYDIVYSKEDASLAAETLHRYGIKKDLLSDLDKAKFLLVVLEIQRQTDQPVDDAELKVLFKTHENDGNDWQRVKKRHSSILQE